MDYKEKVIELLKSQELSKEQKEKLENIFLELQESEEERVKKAIIESLPKYGYLPQTTIKVEDAIAWLEKQGEIGEDLIAKKYLINKGYPIDANGTFPTFEEMYNIIREGLEKQSEKKPQRMISAEAKEAMYDKLAWSKEDEKIITGIINDIQKRLEDYPLEQLAEIYFKEIKWLKSLKQRIEG